MRSFFEEGENQMIQILQDKKAKVNLYSFIHISYIYSYETFTLCFFAFCLIYLTI